MMKSVQRPYIASMEGSISAAASLDGYKSRWYFCFVQAHTVPRITAYLLISGWSRIYFRLAACLKMNYNIEKKKKKKSIKLPESLSSKIKYQSQTF